MTIGLTVAAVAVVRARRAPDTFPSFFLPVSFPTVLLFSPPPLRAQLLAVVAFAGTQLYKALSLKKAPDYDVERHFWRPPAKSSSGAGSLGTFPSLSEPASVTLSVVVRARARSRSAPRLAAARSRRRRRARHAPCFPPPPPPPPAFARAGARVQRGRPHHAHARRHARVAARAGDV